MELKFNKDDSSKIIEYYYKKYEQREVKAKIKSQKTTCAYGMCEIDACSTKIVLEEEIELIGVKTKLTETLSESCLLGIFKTVLEEPCYEVTKAEFDDGINSYIEGCYMNEHSVSRVYCNGIVLNVKKNIKEKKIGEKKL